MAEKQITIMAVHAHPDDEVVFTGGTLALYHNRGVRTVLVTATNGEEGEIHDPDLDPDEARPGLGQIRREELRRAVEILKIDDLELLDYRDSGMAGTDANSHPGNFHNADKDEATRKLVALVRRYKPEIMITYDENGAYGHPDHIAANVATCAAFEKSGDPIYYPELGAPWQPLKLYYTHWAEDSWVKARDMLKERGLPGLWDEEEQRDADPEHESTEEAIVEQQEKVEEAKEEGKPPPYVPPPVTARIDVRDAFSQKRDAIRVHRTQFDPNGPFMSMPEDIAIVALGEEHYSLIESHVPAPETEDDLLAGLD